jgi:hypothetical protein
MIDMATAPKKIAFAKIAPKDRMHMSRAAAPMRSGLA